MISAYVHCQGMACRAGFLTKTTIELNPRQMFALNMLFYIGRPAGLIFARQATPISIRISCDILAHNFFYIYKETSTFKGKSLVLVLEVFVQITHRRETCSTDIAENSGNNMVHFYMIVNVGGFFIEVITLKTLPNFTIIFSLNLNRL